VELVFGLPTGIYHQHVPIPFRKPAISRTNKIRVTQDLLGSSVLLPGLLASLVEVDPAGGHRAIPSQLLDHALEHVVIAVMMMIGGVRIRKAQG
jgi:hypothetical protein